MIHFYSTTLSPHTSDNTSDFQTFPLPTQPPELFLHYLLHMTFPLYLFFLKCVLKTITLKLSPLSNIQIFQSTESLKWMLILILIHPLLVCCFTTAPVTIIPSRNTSLLLSATPCPLVSFTDFGFYWYCSHSSLWKLISSLIM